MYMCRVGMSNRNTGKDKFLMSTVANILMLAATNEVYFPVASIPKLVWHVGVIIHLRLSKFLFQYPNCLTSFSDVDG